MRIVRLAAPNGFTQVANSALRDERLSYKARGIHANLLSNADEGWVESADSLADKSPDGRHAVRTGLQELVKYGYVEYRKTQGPGGKWSTEMIVYTSPKSGFLTPVPPAVSHSNAQVGPGSGNLTSDRGQETRSRSDLREHEFPQVGPKSGFPAFGKPDSVLKTIAEDQQKTIAQPPSEDARESSQLTLVKEIKPAPKKGTKERTPEEQARFEAADALAKGWWDVKCPELGIPVVAKGNGSPKASFPGFRKMIEAAMKADCTENEIKQALLDRATAWPTLTALTDAISDRRGKNLKQPNRRGARPNGRHNESDAGAKLAEGF